MLKITTPLLLLTGKTNITMSEKMFMIKFFRVVILIDATVATAPRLVVSFHVILLNSPHLIRKVFDIKLDHMLMTVVVLVHDYYRFLFGELLVLPYQILI